MEIPITGLLFHSDEAGDTHSHGMYILTWDGRPVHTHPFSGITSFDDGHRHQYAGVTEPAPSGVQHVHRYFTVTSFEDGHTHEIRGTTGPAVPVPGGGHIHYFEGFTTVSGRSPHTHRYFGETGSESRG